MSNAEDDLYSPARDYGSALVQIGTVGWASREEHTELGTADNDGHTFVCVTLYAGKTPGEAVTKGVAQGHEILCHIPDGIFRIPKKGARCWVIIPAGMEELVGAGIIIATVGPGNEIRRNVAAGDTFIGATGGGQAGIVVKANGEVTICTTDDNTPTGKLIAYSIGPKGRKFDSPTGSLKHDATGYHLKTKAGPRFDMGGLKIPLLSSIPGIGTLIDMFGGYATITAPTIRIAGGSVFLGAGKVFNACLNALIKPPPAPMPPPNQVSTPADCLQSQTVFVAP